jgi:gliding motility-associated-like protein
MRITLLLFTITLFFTTKTFSQTTLQLPLDPGRINPGTDLKLAANGDYLMSSYFPGPVITQGGNVNLTRFNLQGGVQWSKDFLFDEFTGGGYVADWPQESAVLLTAFLIDTFYNKVLVKLDPQGNVLWSRRYGKPNDVSSVGIFSGKTLATPLADGHVLLAGGATALFSSVDANDLFVGKIDPDGEVIWARNLCFSCLGNVDAALGNVIPTSDGGFLLTGIVERNFGFPHEDLLLVKLSSEGNVQWAKALDSPGSFLSNDDRGFEVKELPNGHFAIVGEVANFSDNLTDGLIIEVDAEGNFERSVAVRIANSDHTVTLPHLEVVDENTVVVTGSTSQDTLAGAAVQLNFLAQMQLDGTLDWQHSWFPEALLGFGTVANALLPQPGGGYAYLMNDHENFDRLFPTLLLTDGNGETGCELDISLSTSTSFAFTASNLNLTTEPLTFSENFPVDVQDFNGFDIDLPTPDLGPDQTACAPLDLELDATTPGIDSYTWSTGENTPSITVTAPGEYAVTVTDNTLCFSTADTVLVEASAELPTATIELDTTGFCENGFVLLTGSAENAVDLFWSTGDTAAFIQVGEVGEYALTASNDCGDEFALIALELPTCDTLGMEEEMEEEEEETCPLMVPNVFSPNGDGINDDFRPLGKCTELPGYVFKVFSRWGELVFESESLQEGWNGDFRSQAANSDVYGWTLQYADGTQGMVTEKGDVTLLR